VVSAQAQGETAGAAGESAGEGEQPHAACGGLKPPPAGRFRRTYLLRRRGITAVIPEPDDQKRNRARRGSRGSRPVNCDVRDDKARNVVERGFNRIKNWRGLDPSCRAGPRAVAGARAVAAPDRGPRPRVFRGGLVLRAILLWLQPT